MSVSVVGGSFSGALIDLGHGLIKRASATQQGGLVDGHDPSIYNAKDPIRIWVIELAVIIAMTQILGYGLGKLKQPKVIAEVLGGILLGPTVMGRIPGFSQHVFPPEARPLLTLTATIGLVLFLFLVGLEIDLQIIKKNVKNSLIIALGGMALSFGLGAAISVPLYHEFAASYSKSQPYFLLFVAVALSITAFPVLCRILTALNLLDDQVGIVVLSAGAGNDIVGWILLALVVALVNASTGLTALYVLLVSAGWALFTLYPCRWFFKWLARWTGSIEKGHPTPFFMTAAILFTFIQAFMTDIIGVHAIFGGFLAGIVIPRDALLNITITEKLEDMVSIIFLPLYFALSGLSTNLGLLNTGKIWGFAIMILVVDWFGKFTGGTLASRVCGFPWRQSCTVGSLMSCKGLMELIVLNVGLSAGVLDTKIFSMFVLEAVVLTFATTPVVMKIYPPHLRTRAVGAAPARTRGDKEQPPKQGLPLVTDLKTRFLVVLDRMENIPSIMAITQLLHPTISSKASTVIPTMEVEALRLLELTDRTSDLMRSTPAAVEDILQRDPLLSVYRTFGELHDIEVHDRYAVAQYDAYHESVGDVARSSEAQLIIVSWASPVGVGAETTSDAMTPSPSAAHNPFDSLFRTNPNQPSRQERLTSVAHSHFIRRLFASAPVDVALFIDHRSGSVKSGSKVHLFVPFFGGPDDRLALEFVVQLCEREGTTATVVKVGVNEADSAPESESDEKAEPSTSGAGVAALDKTAPTQNTLHNTVHSITRFADTIYPNVTTQTRMASDTADNICWSKYAPGTSTSHTPAVEAALARMEFTSITSPTPLSEVAQAVTALTADGKRTIVVAGRGKRLAVVSHQEEMKTLLAGNERRVGLENEMRKTLGDVATAFVAKGVNTALLVMQASTREEMTA